MRTPRLIRILCRLFNILFYGELLLFFVLMPTFLFIQNFYPDLLFGGDTRTTTVTKVGEAEGSTAPAPTSPGSTEIPAAQGQNHQEERSPSLFSFYIEAKGGLYPRMHTSSTFYHEWEAKLKTPPAVRLTTKQDIQITRSTGTPPAFWLAFGFNNWQEFMALPRAAILLFIGGLVFFLACSLAITYLLKELFNSLAQQDYFGAKQIQRLRQIGWLFISYGLFEYSTYVAKGWLVRSLLEQHQILMNFQVMIGWPVGGNAMLLGAVILVFSQVFAYGQQLKQESELTI